MNSKDKTNLIKYCKKTLPRNSEILFLGRTIELDGLNNPATMCVYLPSTSSMLLGNKLLSGWTNENLVYFYPIQEFLENLTNYNHFDKYDKLVNVFHDLDNPDFIIKNPMMDIISENRNLLIDTKRCDLNDFVSLKHHDAPHLAFVEVAYNISQSFTNCQLSEAQVKNIDHFDPEDEESNIYKEDLIHKISTQGFQWEGIYHQGFVESFILSLYSGITLEDGEDFDFADMDMDDFC